MAWVVIPNYDGVYEINSSGECRNISGRFGHNTILKVGKYRPYPYYTLYKNRISKKLSIHRILAEIFIPNPGNLPEVNHIDGDKMNYSISNLEWVTKSENKLHAFRVIGIKTSFMKKVYRNYREKRVRCDTLDITFSSAAQAERELGIKNVPQICNGRRSQRSGLDLRYID